MTIVNVSEKLLIMLDFSVNLKQIQCFVRKWQDFILFICFLEINFMTYFGKIVMTSLWNTLWAQNFHIIFKIDKY